jgi:hypothetical protein
MTRNSIHVAIAAALFGTLALGGCKKNDDSALTPPPVATEPAPPITPAPTPATALLSITTVDLGNAVGADNRVSAPLSTFATTDTIHASVATDGASPGDLTAKWTFEDGQVVDTQTKAIPAGPQVTDFSISKPDGWPVGDYTLELLVNGMVVQTRELAVQ